MKVFGQQPISDAIRFLRATTTNQLARLLPGIYVRLTKQTGRGGGEERPEQVADYFRTCFYDYFDVLNIKRDEIPDFLLNKKVMEYGPGSIPGVALLMYAHGANNVTLIDRFPLCQLTEHSIAVFKCLIDGLQGKARQRAESCFVDPGDCRSGLLPEKIGYQVRPSGLSGMREEIDMVISRAVLEHVNDLSATFDDMYAALKPGGLALHQVDLKSHGLHQRNPLDFLTWPPTMWNLMYSGKGVPNRWRINRYRQVIAEQNFDVLRMSATDRLSQTLVSEVRPLLAKPFKSVSDDDLTWLGFWVVLKKNA